MGIQTNPAPDDRLIGEAEAAPVIGFSKFVLRKWRAVSAAGRFSTAWAVPSVIASVTCAIS